MSRQKWAIFGGRISRRYRGGKDRDWTRDRAAYVPVKGSSLNVVRRGVVVIEQDIGLSVLSKTSGYLLPSRTRCRFEFGKSLRICGGGAVIDLETWWRFNGPTIVIKLLLQILIHIFKQFLQLDSYVLSNVESAMSLGQLKLSGISIGVDQQHEFVLIDSEVAASIDVEVVVLIDAEIESPVPTSSTLLGSSDP
ncbi:hypothetical protein F2Q68_00044351 [Brassica cretica]|uniref:Uncharacterized protein n=1 Tax=Brassica cretica TaxID=69181 RepID=A0A8S9LMT5_BRACR|nr:hypothetical protein F2Q68_00044351 [Brassica cretica]